uniref:DUF456 domain-containing protein n=1 Tax=Fundidesulfovibrio putealis TaxID=270496 RepID=A0A7C4AI06_9BACT
MEYVWAVAFILLLLGMLSLNILSLPGNWVMLALAWFWDWTHPGLNLGWGYYLPLAAMAVAGEVIEFAAQYVGGKKYGSSSKGNIGAFIGAVAGAIFCAPFLLGLGALFGAVGGAYVGCYVFERMHGRPSAEAWHAAKGAMLGRVLGFVVKIGLGGGMLALIARSVWPKAAALAASIAL